MNTEQVTANSWHRWCAIGEEVRVENRLPGLIVEESRTHFRGDLRNRIDVENS